MYYQRIDVREAVLDFANPGGGNGVRECAIYNPEFRSIQRYIGENGSRRPISLDPRGFERALGAGASAFYCSYWRYDRVDFSHPFGRDLVWTIRAKHGGLQMAKLITRLVVDALEEAGIEPRVKYSGDLGFDVIIPLESIPHEAWMGDLGTLDEIHRRLTTHIVGYTREHFPEAELEVLRTSVTVKIGRDVCLLSELRVRRGLLLAPMSLNPQTKLVSVPVDPARLESFSVLDAAPENVRGHRWAPPTVTYSFLRFTQLNCSLIKPEPVPGPA
jgi:hypothetical protein